MGEGGEESARERVRLWRMRRGLDRRWGIVAYQSFECGMGCPEVGGQQEMDVRKGSMIFCWEFRYVTPREKSRSSESIGWKGRRQRGGGLGGERARRGRERVSETVEGETRLGQVMGRTEVEFAR